MNTTTQIELDYLVTRLVNLTGVSMGMARDYLESEKWLISEAVFSMIVDGVIEASPVIE